MRGSLQEMCCCMQKHELKKGRMKIGTTSIKKFHFSNVIKMVWKIFCNLFKKNCCKILLMLFYFSITSNLSFAQHEMHHMQMQHDTMKTEEDSLSMSHSFSLNLPMNRNSSGTAWQPDATPVYGYMIMGEKWHAMVHGNLFFRYNYQDVTNQTDRADSLTDRLDAPNWIMIMADRRIKKHGLLSLSLMLSADELIMGKDGYPLLFQTGETYNGKALVDRQHPHDFISGLSIAYTQMINADLDITTYFGFPGEPALGPPAFMHRISAFNNPDAPLGHHWQDATHISFGVATLGLRYKILKFEFSSFTGREPNENRYDFDKPRFDSYSYRFSTNPTQNFSIQFSQAFIKSPESLEPDKNITRTTSSILHSIVLDEKAHLTSAVIWGINQASDNKSQHSALIESNLQINKAAVYLRYEFIQKDAFELQIIQPDMRELFWINMLTVGTNYNIISALNTNLRLGVQGGIYIPATKLSPLYGNAPLALEVYLKLCPININAYKMKNEQKHEH